VSRILVADDNSNIQKMVALALKDEGIDVVAVGNGEAAMRKIPDLRPDLVLADIFMPVRNGYEVCEFVKSDSRYMSTPVVLLVGAFDPLDEQETQRVRADGVLKKPFVPPDPLVNMVKALLAKSNGQKPPLPLPLPIPPRAAGPSQTAPQAVPPQMPAEPASQPMASSQMTAIRPPAPVPQQQSDPVAPEQPPVLVNSPKQPVYQGTNTEDSDEVVTAVRDPNLGEPVWATPEEPEEIEEETETKPGDMLDMHSFGQDEEPVERERVSHFRPDPALIKKDDFGDAGGSSDSQTQDAPAQQFSQPNTASEYASDAAAAQYEKDAQSFSTAPLESAAPPEIPVEPFQFDPRLTFPAAPQGTSLEEEAAAKGGSAVTELNPVDLPADGEITPLPWPGVTNSPIGGATAKTEKPMEANEQFPPIELDLPALPDHEAVITAATEAARLAFSELNTLPGSGKSLENSDRNTTAAERKDAPSIPTAAKDGSSPSPEMIDAVVNRLLERMQPQIMEVVNREVLRPAIEAIVRREMKKD
jgi:CheY-like chemotaxis protein